MISREEAIKELEFRRQITGGRFGEALDMAITALKLNPQAAREAIDELIKAAQSHPPTEQWIPCSERLPKETDWYPVTIQYGNEEPYIGISEYYTGEGKFYVCGKAGWYCDGYPVDDCITAWKERPEPYKGVE